MATYYVRNDGTSNKAGATDPTSASTSMSIATFNSETFAANDIVYFSSRGGNLTTAITIPSSGTSGNEITYAGEPDYEPTITAAGGLNQNGKSHIDINVFTYNNSGGTTGFNFEVIGATNITTTNLTVIDAGNQGLQHLNTVSVTHNNLNLTSEGGDECFSMHDSPTVVVNGGTFTANSNASCVNYINTPTATFNDVTFDANGSTSYTIQVAGTGTFSFNRCVFDEDTAQNSRVQDWPSGSSVEYINCIFLNLTDADYYMLARSGVTKFDVINCSFVGDGVNTTTAIFNQDADFKVKNTYFVDCGTEALWSNTGTIDYNGYHNSGTVRGTNTTTGDPNFDSNGKLQSGTGYAIGNGIGPGSDSDIPTDDIDGDARSGSTCDLGADEWAVVGYTLTADSGNYVLSGQTVSLLAGRILTASAGSYTLTGQDASLLATRLLTADSGSYLLTGQDASLLIGRLLSAESGSFTLTGSAAALLAARILTADAGSFTLTGQDANLFRGYVLSCDSGSYVLSGQDASLLADRLLSAGSGSFTLTGQDVTLTYTTNIVGQVTIVFSSRAPDIEITSRKPSLIITSRKPSLIIT
jgi:hypothetical protein